MQCHQVAVDQSHMEKGIMIVYRVVIVMNQKTVVGIGLLHHHLKVQRRAREARVVVEVVGRHHQVVAMVVVGNGRVIARVVRIPGRVVQVIGNQVGVRGVRVAVVMHKNVLKRERRNKRNVKR